MNLNKMLAALMVATASLMVAPLATANDQTCYTPDETGNLSTWAVASSEETDGAAFGERIFRLDVESAALVITLTISEQTLNDDVKVSILRDHGALGDCTFAEDAQSNDYSNIVVDDAPGPQPGSKVFTLTGGTSYYIKVMDDGAAENPAVAEDFLLQVA